MCLNDQDGDAEHFVHFLVQHHTSHVPLRTLIMGLCASAQVDLSLIIISVASVTGLLSQRFNFKRCLKRVIFVIGQAYEQCHWLN